MHGPWLHVFCARADESNRDDRAAAPEQQLSRMSKKPVRFGPQRIFVPRSG
jgi:hypothetical protein